MPRRSFLLPLAALAGAALFLVFLTRLLLLRLERGDVYPAYSTLRADPLGARAIYEALDSIPGYKSTRGIAFLHRELTEKPSTLVFLGLDSRGLRKFSEEDVAALDDYVRKGGRVIITFPPVRLTDFYTNQDSDDKIKKEPKPPAKKAMEKPVVEDKADVSPGKSAPGQTREEKYERDELRQEKELSERLGQNNERAYKFRATLTALWGFGQEDQVSDEQDQDSAGPDKGRKKTGTGTLSSGDEEKKPEVLALRASENGLEDSVPWKSSIYFLRLEPAWTTLYTSKEKPVVIWRKWGKGEIIVASDSYFVSNEGLREDRRPILLNLLAGPPGRVLFDESHLGTEQQEGVMFLLEKYRLEGYLLGLFGVLGLFLWRNSVPLVPPTASRPLAAGGAFSGKDSRSGLINLLRRNVATSEILKICLAEWKRTATSTRGQLQPKISLMDAKLAGTVIKRPEEIVRLYHELREINNPSRPAPSYATKS